MEPVTSSDLFRLVISGIVAGVAVFGVAIGFLTFMFNRIDKRFEIYHEFIQQTCATKSDIYELRNQMTEIQNQMAQEHAALANKVDDTNAILMKHIQDTELHPQPA